MKYLIILLVLAGCNEASKDPSLDEFHIDTTRPPVVDTLGVDTVETIQTIYKRKGGNEPRRIVYFSRIESKSFTLK